MNEEYEIVIIYIIFHSEVKKSNFTFNSSPSVSPFSLMQITVENREFPIENDRNIKPGTVSFGGVKESGRQRVSLVKESNNLTI